MSRGTSSLTVRSGPTLVATLVSFLISSAQARRRARSEAKDAVSHAPRGGGAVYRPRMGQHSRVGGGEGRRSGGDAPIRTSGSLFPSESPSSRMCSCEEGER